jgi:hypothetical protein
MPHGAETPARPVHGDEPLGLTVHGLPAPGEAALQRTARGRWHMFLILLVCAAPVVASYFTYYVVRPQGRRNFGDLIQPQRDLPEASAVALDGRPVPLRSLKGQWLLVSVGGGACHAECERNLYLQRQLRESMGKNKDRVDWVWLIDDTVPVNPALLPALQQATVLRVDAGQLAGWLAPGAGHRLQEHLYVVDPMGRWMLRFPAGLDDAGAAKARSDLNRLLSASASWDEAGR